MLNIKVSRQIFIFIILASFTLLCIALSLSLGAKVIAAHKVWQYYIENYHDHYITAILTIRQERTILAFLAGGCFALATVLSQALLQNQLADPGLLGIHSGSALTVIMANLFPFWQTLSPFYSAFIGAFITSIFLLFFCVQNRNFSPLQLLLAGSALNACLFALCQAIILNYPQSLAHYRLWAVGAINVLSFKEIYSFWPYLLSGVIIAFCLGKALNILIFDQDKAKSLGLNLGVTRLFCLLAIAILSACATAMAGPISFIGLFTVHLMRPLSGRDFRWLLSYSFLGGAILLMVGDILARIILPPQEISLNIIMAIIGTALLYFMTQRVNFIGLK